MGDELGESVNTILSELDELEYSTGEKVEYTDTLESGSNLELEKAQELFDQIRVDIILDSEDEIPPELLENLFEGFDSITSTPNKESESSTTGKTSRVSSLVKSFETLQTSSETKPKGKSKKRTAIERRIQTRTVAKEENSSPLTALEPKKRKIATALRRLQFGNMEKADIPIAGRLNTKGRKNGETATSLKYHKLSVDDISMPGRIVL